MKKLRLALAQMNPVVGDLLGNKNKIISNIKNALEKVSMKDLKKFKKEKIGTTLTQKRRMILNLTKKS